MSVIKGKKFTLSALTVSCLMAFNAQAATDCTNIEEWDSQKAYNTNSVVQKDNHTYTAKWWTQGQDPLTHSGEWQEWTKGEQCENGEVIPPPENQAPTITLVSPSGNDSINTGDIITLKANAADSDGSVKKVVFLVNDSIIDTVTTAPYQTTWTAEAGTHTFAAVAVDDDNAETQSDTLSLSISDPETPNEKPTVDVALSITEGKVGDIVTFTANAADNDGQIEKVDFFVAGKLVGTKATAPYVFDYTVTTSGNLAVFARATDDKGATTDSTLATLNIAGEPTAKNCRPDGLYQTEGVNVPYCTVYDENGRELMGEDHPRRVIGYFTSWRAGGDDQTSYLVKDIPWEQLTHINYAFVSIGADGKANIGNVNDPTNAAVGQTWDGVEVDPALGFKGHFGALATYKEKYGVKTLISIGGWAETGGHFGLDGERVADGGFYTMTTNADGSINHKGIKTFVDSAVEMMRKYKFDGLDIDYEYPTSMSGAGNPDDKAFSEPRRPYLMRSYHELMRVLREEIDKASAKDGIHYMLTIAAPSSGYLLRGMETMSITKYLDYVNIMSYDLHGAWNDHVGHNAALFDTGKDSELAQWNVYGTSQYGGIGYLNTDWAYHYFRGSMPAGRINIGVPYYTRGWQGVKGGENGLWGRAALPNQNECAPGTGEGEKNNCGYGALGINNMWHDKDKNGNEMGAGSNPMWHALNLLQGISGSYAPSYGLDPANDPSDKLVGTYTRHFDEVAVAPWLWNEETKVFLSTEDKASIDIKADYVIDKEIGGIMFWELAGDYNCYNLDANGKRTTIDLSEKSCQTGQGEYHMGNTMTKAIYDKFKTATPYGNSVSTGAIPTESLDIQVSIDGFKTGDQNYPINPKITFTNNTGVTLPGGTEIQFDIPTSTPPNAKSTSGDKLSVISVGHNKENNIGGLEGEMHRVSFTLPTWKTLANGESHILDFVYYLPISGPANYSAIINGKEFALKFEHPDLPAGDITSGNDGDGNGNGGSENGACDLAGVNVYPDWPQKDWQGNPSHAGTGDKVAYEGVVYTANWWTSSVPGSDSSWSLCTK